MTAKANSKVLKSMALYHVCSQHTHTRVYTDKWLFVSAQNGCGRICRKLLAVLVSGKENWGFGEQELRNPSGVS